MGRNNTKDSAGKAVLKLAAFFAPYWIISFLLIFLIFAVVAGVYLLTDMSNESFPLISRVVFIAVILAVAFLMGKFCVMPAVVSGGIYGFGMSVITLIVGLISQSLSFFSLKFWLMLLTGILLGILGAMAGYNTRPKKRYGRFTVR